MKLRHVKTVCQHHFVLEDEDGNLTEQVANPVEISAKDWPAYPGGPFADSVQELEAGLNGPDGGALPPEATPANRATRRAAAKKKPAARKRPPAKRSA